MRRWVIRQHGRVYAELPIGRMYPSNTERYVRRTLALLNRET